MTGAPRSAYRNSDFVIIEGETVRALGDYHAAAVFQRIAWRCDRSGEWRATVAQIAEEIWLTEKQVRKALDRVREVGWIDGEQRHPMDRTKTWRVLWEDDPERPQGRIEYPERPTGRFDGPLGRIQTPPGADSPYRPETTSKSSAIAASSGMTTPEAADPDDVSSRPFSVTWFVALGLRAMIRPTTTRRSWRAGCSRRRARPK